MVGFGRISSVMLVPESTGNGGIPVKLDVPAAPRKQAKREMIREQNKGQKNFVIGILLTFSSTPPWLTIRNAEDVQN